MMDYIKNFDGRALSNREFLECLDYALDLVQEFEAAADACCDSLKKRVAELAS